MAEGQRRRLPERHGGGSHRVQRLDKLPLRAKRFGRVEQQSSISDENSCARAGPPKRPAISASIANAGGNAFLMRSASVETDRIYRSFLL